MNNERKKFLFKNVLLSNDVPNNVNYQGTNSNVYITTYSYLI